MAASGREFLLKNSGNTAPLQQEQFPHGARGQNLHLMSDNGCQPTSLAFMRDCRALGVKQAFTGYNNPKRNADTERFMRTMKEELVWINEWKKPVAILYRLGQVDPGIQHQLFALSTGRLSSTTTVRGKYTTTNKQKYSLKKCSLKWGQYTGKINKKTKQAKVRYST